jgi:hypothetical protein
MAIEKSFVPSVTPGVLRPEYRVDGDSPWQSYPTREAAEEREAELNAAFRAAALDVYPTPTADQSREV